MNDKPNEIFIIKGKKINPVASKTLDAVQFGSSVEETIQNLLESNPAIIPGKQISPVGEEPPKFVHLGKNFPLGIWVLDHLFVDQYGILTFMETKLISNPDASRAVMGKLIDFASVVRQNWYSEKLQKQCFEYYAEKNKNLDDILRREFGIDLDISGFWRLIEKNLRIGKIRLMVVSDNLRPEVRRMVEYLNCELTNAEVFGLELKVYGDSANSMLLVPTLVGQTEAAIAQHNLEKSKAPISTEKLQDEIENIPNIKVSKRLKTIFECAIKNDIFIPASAWDSSPSFSFRGYSDERVVTFYLNGKISIFLLEIGQLEAMQKRDIFIEKLKSIDLLPSEFKGVSHNETIWLLKDLGNMPTTIFHSMLVLFGGYFNKPFDCKA